MVPVTFLPQKWILHPEHPPRSNHSAPFSLDPSEWKARQPGDLFDFNVRRARNSFDDSSICSPNTRRVSMSSAKTLPRRPLAHLSTIETHLYRLGEFIIVSRHVRKPVPLPLSIPLACVGPAIPTAVAE
jgi:hypothetical protein